jgi:myo-inositol-1(or 4)-monophosphatase
MKNLDRLNPLPIDVPLAKLWLIKELAPQIIHQMNFLKLLHAKEKMVSKGKDDYQTVVDVEMGKFLKDQIRRRYSQSEFMIEEEIKPEQMLLRDFSEYRAHEVLWVIDPLDGTTNFVRGSKDYAVTIALVLNGLVVLGVIIEPETNQVYGADHSSRNAYRYKNGTPHDFLNVSDVSLLEEATLSLGLSGRTAIRQFTENLVIRLISNGTISDMRSYGSPVLSSVRVAKGIVDAYCCFAYPWDMAAGSILVKNAGGEITQADGKPWELFSPNGILSNGKIHQELIGCIANG